MKKKILKLLTVVLCLCLVLTACGKSELKEKEDKPNFNHIQDSSVTAAAKATEAAQQPTEEPTLKPAEDAHIDADDTEVTGGPDKPDMEPTNIPVNAFSFADITEEGREVTQDELVALGNILNAGNADPSTATTELVMEMSAGEEKSEIYVNTRTLINNGIKFDASSNNMFGTDMTISSYTVKNENDTYTQYTCSDGEHWYKSENVDKPSTGLVVDTNEFIENYKNVYIKKDADKYIMTGLASIPIDEGIAAAVNCTFTFDAEGNFTNALMTIAEEFTAEDQDMLVTIKKFIVTYKNECEPLKVPYEVLDAGEMSQEDALNFLDELGIEVPEDVIKTEENTAE